MAEQYDPNMPQQAAMPASFDQPHPLYSPLSAPMPPAPQRAKGMSVPQSVIAAVVLVILVFFGYQQTFARYRYVQQKYKDETTVARQIISTYEGVKTIKFNNYNDTSVGLSLPPEIYYHIDVNGIPGQWGYGTYKRVKIYGGTEMDPSNDWEPDDSKQLENTGLIKRKKKIKVTDAMLSRVKVTYSYNWYPWY